MTRLGNARFLLAVLAMAGAGLAFGQTGVAPAAGQPSLEVLTGAWVRPDGGYVILITGARGDGRLDASYFNPNPLPFAKAQASRDGIRVRAFFELQAGGYAGSTYDLVYDAASDQLRGAYYQAVAKQKFDVYFVRRNNGTVRAR